MTAQLAAFVLTALAIELTPGPNMVYLAILAATAGRWPALFATLGVAAGLLIQGTIVAAGPVALLMAHPVAHQGLRWLGSAYLVWLACDSWQESRRPIENDTAVKVTVLKSFRRGFLTNLLNPKAAIFFLTVVPQFLTPQQGDAGLLILIPLYVVIASIVHVSIVVLAGSLHQSVTSPKVRAAAGNIFAGLLVVAAAWLFLDAA